MPAIAPANWPSASTSKRARPHPPPRPLHNLIVQWTGSASPKTHLMVARLHQTSMRISKFIHSCVLIEKDDSRILFDPGKFCFIEGLVHPDQFKNLTAILITHGHPDHVEASALKKILRANPRTDLLTNTQTAMELKQELANEKIQASVFQEGERTIGSFRIAALPAQHAPILGGEAPQNTAYLIDGTLLNPGDSFVPSLDSLAGTPVLLLPIMAPWQNELEMWAFTQRMRPQVVIPIHDGQAKPFFIDHRYEFLAEEFEKAGIHFANLKAPGDSFDWPTK
jgi:L-ascorbate metabolism protein UlaG (beta-lactamase superfamily)